MITSLLPRKKRFLVITFDEIVSSNGMDIIGYAHEQTQILKRFNVSLESLESRKSVLRKELPELIV